MERENVPLEMMKAIPMNPKRIPKTFRGVMGSPRKRRLARTIKTGWMVIIHPELIAVV
jgi:hypothetical protein